MKYGTKHGEFSIKWPALCEERDRLGMTNQQIADKLGISLGKWRNVLSGTRWLTREQAETAAMLLGLRLSQIPYEEKARHIPIAASAAA